MRLDISDEIMSEVLRILQGKFEYSPPALREAEARVSTITQRAKPTERLHVIEADPTDNRILECAVAAKSDYIVTDDKRHLRPLGRYDEIPIVPVADFLKILEQRQSTRGL